MIKNNQSIVINKIEKEGKIIPNYIEDPFYNLQNFEFLKDSKDNLITIGQGSFGKVFLVKHKQSNNKYAIKVVNKEKLLLKNQTINSIYKEISIHQTLIHPNIIRLYSFSEDQKNFYFIMEYAENGSLYNLIKFRKLSEEESYNYFIQVLSSLYFLHNHNLVHRDLKPENLLLNKDNNIKLCDFGLCTDVSFNLRDTFCGTFEYMAPELLNNKPYNQSIDIWSLGILLYEMLHGYSPFKNNHKIIDLNEIHNNVNNEDFTIDFELNLSNECIDLIYNLLELDYNKRIKINEILCHPWIKKFEKKDLIEENSDLNENNDNLTLKKKISIIDKEVNDLNLNDNNKNKDKKEELNNSINDNDEISQKDEKNIKSDFENNIIKKSESQPIKEGNNNLLNIENSRESIKKFESYNLDDINFIKEDKKIEKEDFKYPLKYFKENDNGKNNQIEKKSQFNQEQIENAIGVLENAKNLNINKKKNKKVKLHSPFSFSKLFNPFNCGN